VGVAALAITLTRDVRTLPGQCIETPKPDITLFPTHCTANLYKKYSFQAKFPQERLFFELENAQIGAVEENALAFP